MPSSPPLVTRGRYFLCTPSYWCGGRATRRPSALSTSTIHPLGVGGVGAEEPLGSPGPLPLAIEDDAEAGAAGFGVCIQRLKKVFSSGPNNGVAVAGLELSMRPGQITSLLGANGAGKTTTISMLTGLLPPTSGDAWIGAQSIRTGMRAIRTSLGVCPQQNVLFTTLSPHEHLTLHGELKGIWGGRLASAIDEILALVGLTERANVPSAALSGGQKRKLCLAIALLGGPETCFLDEPTSGMDPHSRRSIWALLRAQREGRTIVLTTHFLDEAEILSDRIAIMAEGSLRCAGSPLLLEILEIPLDLAATPTYTSLTFSRPLTPSHAFSQVRRLSALSEEPPRVRLPTHSRQEGWGRLRRGRPARILTYL